jgi:hypothetical protein
MCTHVAETPALSYRAAGYLDVRQKDGSLIQTYEEFDVYVQRPDRLRVNARLGDSRLTLWFGAGKVTLLDRGRKRVARTGAPADLDGLFDRMREKHGVTLPGQDLLRSRPFETLMVSAGTGTYVDLEQEGETKLHHMAFTEGVLAWQVWLTAGPNPVPYRFVLINWGEAGSPRYEVEFSKWRARDKHAPGVFTPEIPRDAKRVTPEEILAALEVRP